MHYYCILFTQPLQISGLFVCGFLKRELTLPQDACKQKYVRALKAVIIHAQEADIDVLVEKMESCLDALIGGV
jgi:hypothetical protein